LQKKREMDRKNISTRQRGLGFLVPSFKRGGAAEKNERHLNEQ